MRFFRPKILGKLRWGYAAIFERVFEKDGFGPERKLLRSGVIHWISTNRGHACLRLYPESEICLFIRYDDGSERWQPADAYMRYSEGEYDGRVVRVI